MIRTLVANALVAAAVAALVGIGACSTSPSPGPGDAQSERDVEAPAEDVLEDSGGALGPDVRTQADVQPQTDGRAEDAPRSDTAGGRDTVDDRDGADAQDTASDAEDAAPGPTPIRAWVGCFDALLDCLRAGGTHGDCVRNAPVCGTDEPWTESAPCCAAACLVQFEDELTGGATESEALRRVYILDGTCMPGIGVSAPGGGR